ncbi:MAG: Crp/Fnr family transcriptional regulator [Saccharofermentanales bacterium]
MLNKEEWSFVRSRLYFWDKLSVSEKAIIENNISKVTYNKGSIIHSNENNCLGVLLILSGDLSVCILSDDGREVTLYRLSSGDICVLSASCILNSITFDVQITAETETTAFLINIAAFSTLSQQNVYVENFAYKNTVERFSDVMWAIEQILFKSFDKRLAIFLLDEISKTNSSDINLTQEQIAKHIGSAREVVSRMLKIFQTQGIIEQSRGFIHVLDKNKLKKLI